MVETKDGKCQGAKALRIMRNGMELDTLPLVWKHILGDIIFDKNMNSPVGVG